MKISINSVLSDHKISGDLYYDSNGNVIMHIVDFNKYYYLAIDHRDMLEFVEINDYETLDPASDIHEVHDIKNVSDDMSLRKKAIDELNKKKEEDLSDSDEDGEDHKNFFPEKDLYYVDENMKYKYEKFYFAQTKDCPIQQLDKSIDGFANYDIVVFDTSNNRIMFSSELNFGNGYKITLNTNGIFTLNIVGSKIINMACFYNLDHLNIYFSLV